jgi:hypothetical protein
MIYNGTLKLGEVVQDFDLKFLPDSWVGKIKYSGKKLPYKQFDLYTVSSHGASYLYKKMVKHQRYLVKMRKPIISFRVD